ncbi:Cof-type HAD-IIB family hydrolase [Sellimonas sp.]|uniref:Cof-type HAD-IIB family hydrolase n=1 Tax=Sellimonas sp. TaxID=2021466 RepID=UPI00257E4307|nr:Cof-type HAD-IIB family hydrolase [Sellimonas sp.]
MKYQVLVLDLDGTLTNSSKQITPPTKQALIDIQENGKRVVLASGRPTQGVLPLAKELKMDHFGNYILSFNGGKIIDCRTGNVIYNKTIPNSIVTPLFEIVKQYDADIIAYTDKNLISGIKPNQYTKLESRINNMPILQTDHFTKDVDFPNNKFLISGEPDVIELIQKETTHHFRGLLNIYCSEPFFLEIMPQNIDKAYSLLKLLSSIGLDADEMICCGDGYNDITMIETAGLGVAMQNAQPLVQEKADYITKSNDEDGVLHVIQQFLLD